MNALQIAIDAMLSEQQEREDIIARLIQLNNGVTKHEKKARLKIELPRGCRPNGPTAQILTALKKGPLSQPEIVEAGVPRAVISGALMTLRKRKLVKVSGTPKHYVYALT